MKRYGLSKINIFNLGVFSLAISNIFAGFAFADNIPPLPEASTIVKWVTGRDWWNTSIETRAQWARWNPETSSYDSISTDLPGLNENVYLDNCKDMFCAAAARINSMRIDLIGGFTFRIANGASSDTPSFQTTEDLIIVNATSSNQTLNFVPRGLMTNGSVRYAYLNVGGDIYVNSNDATANTYVNFGTNALYPSDTKGPLNKIIVGGNLYLGGNINSKAVVAFNVGTGLMTDPYDISSPDLTINGIIQQVGTDRTYLNLSNRANQDTAFRSVISVGGVDGRVAIQGGGATKQPSEVVLVLNNAAGTSYDAKDTFADINSPGFSDMLKLKIVMNGQGSQKLSTTSSLKFSGGVTVNSGTLLVSGKAGGSNDTEYTHGDLEMNGGTFGIFNNTAGAGTFTFKDCYWKSGTLVVGTYDDAVDVLSFSGSFMEGSGEVSSIKFSFDGDCTALLQQKKIIDCSDFSSFFTSDSFQADDAFINGDTYAAQFELKDDGLYVQYVAVPEPAAFAALLGIFAVAFSFARRKNR